MIDEKDIEDIRRWRNHLWAQLAEELGVDTATLWRWRKHGVPDGPAQRLLERLKAEMTTDLERTKQ